MQLSYHSGRKRILSPRDERTLVQKVKINPRTTAKDHVKMLEETATKVSISTVKRDLYRHNVEMWKLTQALRVRRHSHLLTSVTVKVLDSCMLTPEASSLSLFYSLL